MDLRRLVEGLRATNRAASPGFGGVCARREAQVLVIALGLAAAACTPEGVAPGDTRTAAASAPDVTGSGNLDILFMIDDSPGMAAMQDKLVAQIPLMMNELGSVATGFPNTHIAVISSDLGAVSDDTPTHTGCAQTGDQGVFQARPRGTCGDSTLTPGATFISNAYGVINYTAANIADVVQCILPLGDSGCGFVHPLASIARALGADGMPVPASNAGFLRQDAMLAIIILTHQDDCSASSPLTGLYSYNNGPDNLINSLGPLDPYRCNEFGHLCRDPHGQDPTAFDPPPEVKPTDAQGTSSAPTLDLADCQSNESGGLLTPVATFVDEVRALKPDPEHQIVVGAIVGPPAPYTVAWVPAAGIQDAAAPELWPQIEHSCGGAGATGTNPEATQLPSDGSFGDPAVRVTQFVNAFGVNGRTASVCDSSYAGMMQPLVDLIAANVPFNTIGVTGAAGDAGTASVDGSAVTGAAGASGPGAGGPGAGGAGGSGVDIRGATGNGLHTGGCSVASSDPAGWGLAALLAALAMARGRAARGAPPKNVT